MKKISLTIILSIFALIFLIISKNIPYEQKNSHWKLDPFDYYKYKGADLFENFKNTENKEEKENQFEEIIVPTKILIEGVPFTSQAPFGEWDDDRQQDGCEEASSLMAIYWAQNKSLNSKEARNIIISLSDFLQKKYKEYRDTSAKDTLDWIINDYFNYQNAFYKENISKDDIISELAKGNLIIAPMDGQKLKNPNFTAPGPERHMLVIRGYDLDKNIFITNDPGTRKGELYQYDADLFFNAIRDYPTGYKKEIKNIQKNIIVISK
jgi:hypothetical protein